MKHNYTKNTLLFIVMVSLSLTAFAQIIADGTYQIANTVNTEAMTIDTAAPYEAKMGALNETDPFQLWTFTHQGGDIYIIENMGSNTTLGVNDGWCGQFGDVRANFTSTDANVEFKVVSSDEAGKYIIEIAFTTCNFGSMNDPIKAFDIENGAVGGQIQTFDKDISNPNQKFEIVLPGTLSTPTFNTSNKVKVFYSSSTGLSIERNYESSNTLSVKIYDLTGKVVKTQHYNSRAIQVDVSDLSEGIYIVQTTEENTVNSVQKVVIY